jgi:DNA-directed RNA polymerase sigma subunit (sigma70/sigma32)
MTPKQIRKVIEDYPNYVLKKESLQKRLINLGGRDPEQELTLIQRLEDVENVIEIVEYAIYEDELLTPKEAFVVECRVDGSTYQEIGDLFSLSRERVRQILDLVYKKIAVATKKQNMTWVVDAKHVSHE